MDHIFTYCTAASAKACAGSGVCAQSVFLKVDIWYVALYGHTLKIWRLYLLGIMPLQSYGACAGVIASLDHIFPYCTGASARACAGSGASAQKVFLESWSMVYTFVLV